MRKILVSILTVIMLINLFELNTLAIPVKPTQDLSNPSYDIYCGTSSDPNNKLHSPLMTLNGNVAYCIDAEKIIPTGQDYISKTDMQDTKLYNIIRAGYPYTASAKGLNNRDYYYCTQVAIWMYQWGKPISWLECSSQSFLDEVTRIYNAQSNSYSPTSPYKVTVQTNNSDVSIVGSNYRVGDYVVRVNGNLSSNYTVNLDFAPEGTQVIRSASSFYFHIPTTSSLKNSSLQVTVTSTGTQQLACSVYAVGDDYQRVAELVYNTPTGSAYVEKVFPEPLGRIEVTKKDDKGTALSGAIFEFKHTTLGTTYNVTANAQGKASKDYLDYGKWQITEIQAPTGYLLDSTPQYVTLDDSNMVSTSLTFTNNQIKGYIDLTKTDVETGDKLQGAIFGIYKAEDNSKVGELTTDINGYAKSGLLPYGQYYLKEVQAPTGYVLNDTTYPVSITNNGATVSVSAENTKIKGYIDLTKTDAETGDKLQGAIFGIYKAEDNSKVGELTTDINGYAKSGLLPYGQYYLKEVQAPTGYVLNDTTYPVSITNNGATVSVSAENTKIKGKIKIEKHCNISHELLSGAVYGIYKADNDTLVQSITTDKTGYVESDFIPYGSYYIKEIKSPQGYDLDTTEYPFSISEAEKILAFDLENTAQIGTVIIETSEITESTPSGKYDNPKTSTQTNQTKCIVISGICFLIIMVIVYDGIRKGKKQNAKK